MTQSFGSDAPAGSGRTARRRRLTNLFRARRAHTALVLATLVVAGPAAAAAAVPDPVIPQGAALWFACTQPQFAGPLFERCPLPYDPRYLQTFLASFTRFTPENEFKMAFLEPRQGEFNFTVADQIGAFAQDNHKTIRGHTLIWNEQNPLWLSHPLLPWTSDTLTNVMHTYISTVVSHFASAFPGVVTDWDVVNEPLTNTGALAWSPWEAVLGPQYIRMALLDAHAADPTAHLLINDNGADVPGPKAEALLALATGLRQQGAPLYGVGFEAHVTPDTAPTLPDLVSLWRRYAAAGLDVEVTELDVADDHGVDDPAAKQAVIERYAEACRMVSNCTGFTTWGVADSYSWLGGADDSNALLYNSAFQPSPVTGIVEKLLGGETPRQLGLWGSTTGSADPVSGSGTPRSLRARSRSRTAHAGAARR